MKRKLYQTVNYLLTREKEIGKKFNKLQKKLGIKSDTEIVRFCINYTYEQYEGGE